MVKIMDLEKIITDLIMVEINNKAIVILTKILQIMKITEIDQGLIKIIDLTITAEDLIIEIDKVEILDLTMEIDH